VPRSTVTIRDVAALAGVSHQTVSRVINGYERVNPETRQRVEEAIEQLGYRPNAVARSMANGRTRMLACFSPNLTDFTFASLIEGAEQYCRQNGYFLLSATAPDEETFACLVEELLRARRVDGLMVFNPYSDQRHALVPRDIPLVYAGIHTPTDEADTVSLDDREGGRIAAYHLVNLGHRRIAGITGPLIEDCTRERLAGFQEVLLEAGVAAEDRLTREGDWSVESGYRLMSDILASGAQFDALFAQNDRMAIGAIHALREAGMKVPGDVSVIGFDDVPLAAYQDPPLTTVRQELLEIGREAALLLIQRIERPDQPRQHRLLPARLVERDSVINKENVILSERSM
jgi:DNA-binding LacI/PurR family transcriptional regulator